MEEYVNINKADEEFLRKYMPSFEASNMIADFYSVFGDNTRIRILSALSIRELCVNDLSKVLGQNQTTISHQLKTLKDQGMVDCKREGKVLIYFLKSSSVNEMMLYAVREIV